MALSERLRMLAGMVTAGNRVADVGCDHAFLSIYLVQTGKCPGCLAMDVRKGPLAGAEEHIAAHRLEEYIETRLSDGLAAYHTGEAETLVCAGMGGRLMERLLTEGGEKTRSFEELILQPQSEIPGLRRFLRAGGFVILQEDAVYEEGKYYFAMRAVYGGGNQEAGRRPEKQRTPAGGLLFREQGSKALCHEDLEELYDLYGEQLLLGRHPVLGQYLSRRLRAVERLLEQLQQSDTSRSRERQRELYQEKGQLEKALALF